MPGMLVTKQSGALATHQARPDATDGALMYHAWRSSLVIAGEIAVQSRLQQSVNAGGEHG